MDGQRTFIEELRHQYRYGGMTIKLLFVNVIIFLAINILLVLSRLIGGTTEGMIAEIIGWIFTLKTDLSGFIKQPWGLFTYMFAHTGIFHVLFNMIFLFVIGKMFEQFFDSKRLLYTYILAGLGGGLFELIAHLIFPGLQAALPVVGASGSIMGIFMAMAFYKPQLKVMLFGVFPVRLIWLALAFFLIDFLALGRDDGTAHFAHVGGAVIGLLSIQNIHSPGNIVNATQRFIQSITGLFSGNSPGRSGMRVKKGGGGRKARVKTDEEYAVEAKLKQKEIDRILDKISKSGYESLTKKEKEFLFNQSKNG